MEDKKFKYVIEEVLRNTEPFCVSESEHSYLRPCIYCGVPADSVDHIPPQSMRAQLSEVELAAIHEREVDACRECNSALGARPLLTLTERRAYIRDWLRNRYKVLLRIPNWTAERLETVGPDLRKMIQRNMIERDYVKRRIAWSTQSGSVFTAKEHSSLDGHGRSFVKQPADGLNGNRTTLGLKHQQRCRWCKQKFETPQRFRDYCQNCISIESMCKNWE